MWQSEPVRSALYPIIVLVVGFAAARGLIDNEAAVFIGALASLILGALGIEVARSKVSPVALVVTPSEADLESVTDDEQEPLGKELS